MSYEKPMKNHLEAYNDKTGRSLIGRVNEHSRKTQSHTCLNIGLKVNIRQWCYVISQFSMVVMGTGSLRGKYWNPWLSNRKDLH